MKYGERLSKNTIICQHSQQVLDWTHHERYVLLKGTYCCQFLLYNCPFSMFHHTETYVATQVSMSVPSCAVYEVISESSLRTSPERYSQSATENWLRACTSETPSCQCGRFKCQRVLVHYVLVEQYRAFHSRLRTHFVCILHLFPSLLSAIDIDRQTHIHARAHTHTQCMPNDEAYVHGTVITYKHNGIVGVDGFVASNVRENAKAQRHGQHRPTPQVDVNPSSTCAEALSHKQPHRRTHRVCTEIHCWC